MSMKPGQTQQPVARRSCAARARRPGRRRAMRSPRDADVGAVPRVAGAVDDAAAAEAAGRARVIRYADAVAARDHGRRLPRRRRGRQRRRRRRAAAAGRDGLRADAGARAPTTRCGGCSCASRAAASPSHANLIVPAHARRTAPPATSSWSRPSTRRCRARTRSASRRCCSRPAWSRCTSRRRRFGSRRRRASSRCAPRAATGGARASSSTNVPCFADRLDAPLEVDGLGTLTVDVAFGGMWYAIADAAALGFALEPSEARELCARRRADPRRGARAAAVRASGEPGDRRREHRPDRRAVAGRGGGVEERRRRRARAASTARRRAPASRRAWRRCTRAARCASATR